MPVYKLQGPDGKVYTIEGPQGATADQLAAVITGQPQSRVPVAPEPAPDPSEGGGTLSIGPFDTGIKTPQGVDRFLAGAGKAFSDIGQGVSQFLPGGATKEDVEATRQRDAPLMDTGAGIAGNVAGQIGASLAPGGLMGAAGRGIGSAALTRAGATLLAPKSIPAIAGVGAAMGAVQPSTSTEERATNAGLGAVAGLGGVMAGRGLGRILSPNTRPEVQALLKEGITPTPGQVLGGRAQIAEDKLMSVPVLGDFIANGRQRSVEDLNRAMYQRALSPIGQDASKLPVGRDGVAAVSDALGQSYDNLIPKMTVKPDAQLTAGLGQITGNNLPPAQAQQLARILQDQVENRLATGQMDGETLKGASSELRRLGSGYSGDASFDNRQLGEALMQADKTLMASAGRQNPAQAAELAATDKGYANYVRIRDAAARSGSRDGVASPAQLSAAVRATDKSVGKGNFARGRAGMQDLSDAALDVLGPKYPDSGTAGRVGLAAALSALGGTAAVSPGAAITAAAAASPMLAYTPVGQRLAAALLASRPEASRITGEQIKKIAPYLALPAAGAAQ